MKFFTKKWWMAVIAFTIMALVFTGAAYGVSMFIKTVAGIGDVTYTNAVAVTDIKVKSLTKVDVTVASNANTVADKVYTVHLYDGDTEIGSPQTVSWLAGEIPGPISKKISFTGLSLEATTNISAEVTE